MSLIDFGGAGDLVLGWFWTSKNGLERKKSISGRFLREARFFRAPGPPPGGGYHRSPGCPSQGPGTLESRLYVDMAVCVNHLVTSGSPQDPCGDPVANFLFNPEAALWRPVAKPCGGKICKTCGGRKRTPQGGHRDNNSCERSKKTLKINKNTYVF